MSTTGTPEGRNAGITAPEGTSLYAVAYEYWSEKLQGWVPDIMHLHAMDSPNARFLFLKGIPHGKRVNIVAVGPVIGYFALDDNGDKVEA